MMCFTQIEICYPGPIAELWIFGRRSGHSPLHGLSKVTNVGRACSEHVLLSEVDFVVGEGSNVFNVIQCQTAVKLKISVFSSSLECGIWGITEPNSRSRWMTDPSDSSCHFGLWRCHWCAHSEQFCTWNLTLLDALQEELKS